MDKKRKKQVTAPVGTMDFPSINESGQEGDYLDITNEPIGINQNDVQGKIMHKKPSN